MEEELLRFPHLGEAFFKISSKKDLVKCKMVSRSWYHFIVNQKFYNQKVYYEKLQKKVVIGNTHLHKAARDGDFQKCKLIIDHVENKNPTLVSLINEQDLINEQALNRKVLPAHFFIYCLCSL